MANYGPNDTELVVVVGYSIEDAQKYIHLQGKRSEVTYVPEALRRGRLEGLRWNRLILTEWAKAELMKAQRLLDAALTLRAAERRLPPDARIVWPDGI